MTSPTLLAVSTVISLIGLWVVFFWLYRDYRVDLFRDRMFALRSELFDLAASGAVSFDDPAYAAMRTMINGYIRFAHRISLLVIILISRKKGAKESAAQTSTRLMTLLSKHPPEVRQRLEAILGRMHFFVIDQIILTSTSMWLFLIPVATFMGIKGLGGKVLELARESAFSRLLKTYWVTPMDSEAITAGAN